MKNLLYVFSVTVLQLLFMKLNGKSQLRNHDDSDTIAWNTHFETKIVRLSPHIASSYKLNIYGCKRCRGMDNPKLNIYLGRGFLGMKNLIKGLVFLE